MKYATIVLACVFTVFACGCRQQSEASPKSSSSESTSQAGGKITKEYLLSHGFSQDGQLYVRKNARLVDIAAELGFSTAALRRVVNCPAGVDIRYAELNGAFIVIEARTEANTAAGGDPAAKLLDNSETSCQVAVNFNYGAAEGKYKPTASNPQIKVISVIVPQDVAGPLTVQCQITAQGADPLAISPNSLGVDISQKDHPYMFSGIAELNSQETILIPAGKSTTLSMKIADDCVNAGKTWRDLPAGNYTLKVNIGTGKDARFDYQWLGSTRSEGYPLTLPKKK